MSRGRFPARDKLNILFAHAAYRFSDRILERAADLSHIEVRTLDDLKARAHWADVVVVSGLWRNEVLDAAPKLKFVQSVSAGTDQYDKAAFRAKGVRLASAAGVNERAVAEHAVALMLSLTRQLHLLREDQVKRKWRGLLSDLSRREEELNGKTLLIVGLGRIGSRLATIAKAFGMRVIATKRDEKTGGGAADAVYREDRLRGLLPDADFVVLTCPHTPQTERLINSSMLASMKPSAYLINVARGRVVDEPALAAALRGGLIAGAGLDCFWEEPLPETSPLWTLPNVVITPHSAGETRRYEDNVLDILLDNLERLWRGETSLRNEVV
jgi:phosphoglycerate dehydrogenase-like enzyme